MLVRDIIAPAAARLAEAGLDNPRLDARLLLAEALDRGASSIFSHDEVDLNAEQADRFEGLIARRLEREPVSRILGRREFWSLEFELCPETLDPRPDSETVIEAALDLCPQRTDAIRILDLGTGTGCLLLALLSEYKNAVGTGVDIDANAIGCAARNAKSCGLSERVTFTRSNWLDAVTGQFDLIVSNPPYIPGGDLPTLAAEVRLYDPERALDGGTDGLDAYRIILNEAPHYLKPGGKIVVEHGVGQENDIIALMEAIGLSLVKPHKDLSNRTRCVSGVMKLR